MSRSYRKPYATDQQSGGTKEVKRKASRRVRKAKDVASGSAYKKEFESWDIRDWSFYSPNDRKVSRK